MTSNEALKDISYLILQEVDNLKNKDLWKEALNLIKQDLESFEKLKEYGYYDLLQQIEKLKTAIGKELELLRERRETFWYTDSYDEYAVVNEIIEEFEEALHGTVTSLRNNQEV